MSLFALAKRNSRGVPQLARVTLARIQSAQGWAMGDYKGESVIAPLLMGSKGERLSPLGCLP